MNRWLPIAVVGLSILIRSGGPVTARAQVEDMDRALEEAKELYEQGVFAQAIAKLQAVIGKLEQLRDIEIRKAHLAEAQLHLGLTYLALNDPIAAKESFKEVLRLKPNHNLDPVIYAPKVITIFEEAREEVALEPPTALPVEEPPETIESEPVVDEPPEPPRLSELQTIYIEEMPNDLHHYLATEMTKVFKGTLRSVRSIEDADAILAGQGESSEGLGQLTGKVIGIKETSSATVILLDNKRQHILWTSEAGDRSLPLISSRGPGKVASRLMKNLEKAIKGRDR